MKEPEQPDLTAEDQMETVDCNKVCFRNELIRHIGKRLTPFRNSRGDWFVGVGHPLSGLALLELVDIGAGRPRRSLSEAECDVLLDKDIQEASACLDRLLPSWTYFDGTRQRAMLHLAFDLRMKLGAFVGFLIRAKDKQWAVAAGELRNSRWYQQSGARGKRVVGMIEAGATEIADE